MKIILGVDDLETAAKTVDCLKALNFAGAEVYVVHTIEPMIVPVTDVVPANEVWMTDYIRHQQTEALKVLATVATTLKGVASVVHTEVLHGTASGSLADFAEAKGADLIALGTLEKKGLMALIEGSTSRAVLSSAGTSILIAKGQKKFEGGVRAVLATDHSEYCKRAIESFIALNPKGLKKVGVVSVLPAKVKEALERSMEALKNNAIQKLWGQLEELNQGTVSQLSTLGCPVESIVKEGEVNQKIKEVVAETDANLLIVGARGHGLVERALFGSTSFHQVTEADCSVLVLRE